METNFRVTSPEIPFPPPQSVVRASCMSRRSQRSLVAKTTQKRRRNQRFVVIERRSLTSPRVKRKAPLRFQLKLGSSSSRVDSARWIPNSSRGNAQNRAARRIGSLAAHDSRTQQETTLGGVAVPARKCCRNGSSSIGAPRRHHGDLARSTARIRLSRPSHALLVRSARAENRFGADSRRG